MTTLVFGTTDPKTQKKWSANLAVDQVKQSYFEQRFIGTDDNNIIQRKTELESDAGDRVSFDLCVQLRNKPTYGDNDLKGNNLLDSLQLTDGRGNPENQDEHCIRSATDDGTAGDPAALDQCPLGIADAHAARPRFSR